MSPGEIAGLVAAFAFVLLVGVVAVPLVKLGRLIDEARGTVRGLTDETVPLVREVTTTVTTTNGNLVKLDGITGNVQEMSGNVSAFTALLVSTLGRPMLKASSFSYGVREALSERRRPTGTRRAQGRPTRGRG
ncbi:DUF948 domain-containing protein [Motilibacter aurantiacus]|uniref:DUF948 domain-containing protein n=1 Tax=Motilibacter aurantiacus TaxID=2714955 RepID=UPI001409CB6D|nr:DUF948 domain-containing protein [Motilibacter aurantiacus]NHC46046.1 DUF948 domain-containing protein [Motilibacter aurantiacus]